MSVSHQSRQMYKWTPACTVLAGVYVRTLSFWMEKRCAAQPTGPRPTMCNTTPLISTTACSAKAMNSRLASASAKTTIATQATTPLSFVLTEMITLMKAVSCLLLPFMLE